MKKDIHPQYYPAAHVKCACGNEFLIGATQELVEVETCSKCHPFYTGAERGSMRGGRVEKFQHRLERQVKLQEQRGAPKGKSAKRKAKKEKKGEKKEPKAK